MSEWFKDTLKPEDIQDSVTLNLRPPQLCHDCGKSIEHFKVWFTERCPDNRDGMHQVDNYQDLPFEEKE